MHVPFFKRKPFTFTKNSLHLLGFQKKKKKEEEENYIALADIFCFSKTQMFFISFVCANVKFKYNANTDTKISHLYMNRIVLTDIW